MITRRSLFERSGVLALSTAVWPSWMPRMAFRKENEAPKGDILIVVFARGGYDGLNMVIPYLDEAHPTAAHSEQTGNIAHPHRPDHHR